MDIEKLKNKLSELLNITEDEKEYALSVLKNKLVNYLKLGEAIRIENLGVFQLKEKIGDDKKTTMLFSPNENVSSNEALFINLEIDSKEKNDTEFSEDVFQVGINKRFIPVGKTQEGSNKEIELEKQIDDLIETSEKIENFDLWDDYLKDKESTSILNNESEEGKSDSFFEDNITLDDDPLYGKDFVELDEDEIFNEIIDENNLLDEDDDVLTNVNESEDKDDDILTNVSGSENKDDVGSKDELIDVSDTDGLGEDEIVQEFEDNIVENEAEEPDKLDEIDLEYSDEEMAAIEKEDTILPEEKNTETEKPDGSIDESNNENTKEESTATELGALAEDDKSTTNLYSRNRLGKKRKSPIIYALIAGFIIVGAIGIYYIFFQNPTWLYDKYEIETELSEKYEQELKKEKTISGSETEENKNNNDAVSKNAADKNQANSETETSITNKVTSTSKEKLEGKIQETKKIADKKKQKGKNIAGTTKKKSNNVEIITASNNETEAAKNIYFDGKDYSIQVSSWKQNSIAKKEAQKLIAKGYPAYIVKKYIAKFNGTWHRVRVGPYPTIGEAKSVQRKIK